jgi:K+/H+ antiporter YhaU regulatory subunit KhtT
MMQFLKSILSLKQDNDELRERLIKLEKEVQANKRVQDEQSKAIAQIAANLVMITEEFTTIVSNLKVILHSSTIEEDHKLIMPEDKRYVN